MTDAVCTCCGSTVPAETLADEEEVSEVMDRLGIRRAPAILFLILWKANGRTVTYDTLMDTQERLCGNESVSVGGIRTAKKHLWKVIRHYPVEILPSYGVGYRLKLTDRNWNWRDVPLN